MSDIDNIKKQINKIQGELDSLRKEVNDIGKEDKGSVDEEIPGVLGFFDGYNLVTDNNQKYEVPANYAAKSRIVYGDKLKMVDQEGKKMFKLVEKVKRKKVDGILNKKEGNWFFITDSGSYQISNNAAEFNKAELNDEAVALLPEDNLSTPFATLDKIIKHNIAKPEIKETSESNTSLELQNTGHGVIELTKPEVTEKEVDKPSKKTSKKEKKKKSEIDNKKTDHREGKSPDKKEKKDAEKKEKNAQKKEKKTPDTTVQKEKDSSADTPKKVTESDDVDSSSRVLGDEDLR